MSLILKEIDKETHVEFLKNYQTFSFLQLPCWAEVKSGWKSKSVGWFDERKLVCVGLILIRNIPKTKWSLFYLLFVLLRASYLACLLMIGNIIKLSPPNTITIKNCENHCNVPLASPKV